MTSPAPRAAGPHVNPPRWQVVTRPLTVESYLARIDEIRVQGVDAIVRKGEVLIEAKEHLRHGEWQRLSRHLPFSVRHAHRLRSIAAHPILSNRTFVSDLPEDLVVLYILSRVDAQVVEAAIRDGRIHPGMTQRDARLLAGAETGGFRAKGGPSRGREPKPWSLTEALRRIRRVVTAAPASEHPALAAGLQALADELDGTQTAADRRRTSRPDAGTVREVIAAGLRVLTAKYHPDRGGDGEKMKAVNAAVEYLRRHGR